MLADRDLDYRTWFGNEENHISILILAWAELMPGSAIEYNGDRTSQSGGGQDAILVDAGNIDNDATRWWTAILAPDGWQAYIRSGNAEYKSPWSIVLQSFPSFKLSCREDATLQTSAISATTALRYLSEYCNLHGITDQSYAALSAALMLPLLSPRGFRIRLPIPKLHCRESTGLKASTQIDHEWLHKPGHLDKLIALSCNSRGVRSLLSSAFYDLGVACNLVSPWLQAIFATLDSVDDSHLIHIMATRNPHLAFLWLGGIITGLHSDILRDGRCGLITVELHAAMWTGTIQSFIQTPLSKPSTVSGCISRADVCRLLYAQQEEYHDDWPTCQWAPFGQTTLEHADKGVHSYAENFRGGLTYVEWRWACKEGKVAHHALDEGLTPVSRGLPQDMLDIPIRFEALKDEQVASENATRSIFSWLRFGGYPANERDIFRHEWFVVGASDEDAHYEAIQRAERLRRRGLEQPK